MLTTFFGPTRTREGTDMNQPSILIVDDDDNNRGVICDALGGDSYKLLEAANGQQALEIAGKEMPDLILLDVLMPGMDGIAILHKLKERPKTSSIPVIMVTALNMDSQISVCLDGGAIDHIVKPFSGLVIRARVRAALRNRAPAATAEGLPSKHGKVIGFLGAKGGVGTTTTAVNVALALLAPERSVVAVEMHPCMGAMAQQLGVTASLTLKPLLTCQDTGDINARTLGRCLTQHPTGLQLLLTPPDFDDPQEIAPQRAEDIIKTLAGMAEYVIVDFPCQPTQAVRVGLRCCKFVVLAVELEAVCLDSAQAMLKGLNSWGIGGVSVGAVLLHRPPGVPTITVSHARMHLDCRIIGVIPPEQELPMVAGKTGQPLVLSHPGSTGAVALTELAARLMADQVPALTF
jgi:CheY-like chemotaxis protein/MinD-like ATPase involved in chromosome partitioning or flagellar assembly